MRSLSSKNIFLSNSNQIKIVDPYLFNIQYNFKQVFKSNPNIDEIYLDPILLKVFIINFKKTLFL